MKFVLKKKKKLFLKPKQICILWTRKSQKKEKEKKEQRYIAKKKSYWEIWDSKLKKRHCRTGTSRRHRSYEQGWMQNVDVKV